MGAAAAGCALPGVSCAQAAGPEAAPVEARFYERLEDKLVRCDLCPRHCVVPPGGRGECGVRENRDGRYVSLVYGRPCALNLDPIEKKPLFHVLPGTAAFSIATVGCNIECKFCQNWDISQARPEDVRARYRSPGDIAALAAARGAPTIAYTYSEPTVFSEYMIDCARAARERGLHNVMISNGYISERPLQELCSLMTAVKIDLKAFTDRFYRETCGGELEPVLETLKRLADSGIWYEIVVLIVPTLNDGEDEIRRMADWIVRELGPDVPVHFSRFRPAYKLRNLPPTPPATLQRARRVAGEQGCRYVYLGNLPGTDAENTHCPACGATVVERYGYFVRAVRLNAGNCARCGHPIPGVWGPA